MEGLAAALIQSQVAETSGLKSLLEKQGFKAKDWREEETDIRNKGMVTSFLNQTYCLIEKVRAMEDNLVAVSRYIYETPEV